MDDLVPWMSTNTRRRIARHPIPGPSPSTTVISSSKISGTLTYRFEGVKVRPADDACPSAHPPLPETRDDEI